MSREGATRIWIQGAGELASGVAWRLTRCGYDIRLAEIANPLAVRRLVAFSEAVFEGSCHVEGIRGRLLSDPREAQDPGTVGVLVDPEGESLGAYAPAAVIDARMTKRVPRPLACRSAFLIGLGPGFTCGVDADRIIETHRAARLGEVLSSGSAAPNTGVPGLVGGQTALRVVHAPVAGSLVPSASIGDIVEENTHLGTISGEKIYSRLGGLLRGLVHPRAELSLGDKVADVDPRGSHVDPGRITDKALAVAGGVLEALLSAGIGPREDRG